MRRSEGLVGCFKSSKNNHGLIRRREQDSQLFRRKLGYKLFYIPLKIKSDSKVAKKEEKIYSGYNFNTVKVEITTMDLLDAESRILNYLDESWGINYNPNLFKFINDFNLITKKDIIIYLSTLIVLYKTHYVDLTIDNRGIISIVKYNSSELGKINYVSLIIEFFKFFIHDNQFCWKD